MARIEAPRVADHAGEPGRLLLREHRFGVGEVIGERNLDLDMLTRVHALDRLRSVHLRGGAEDHRVDAGLVKRLGEVGAGMRDAVLRRDCLRRLQPPPDQADDFHAVDVVQAVEVFLAERARAGQCDLHKFTSGQAATRRSTIWPTAVLLAGTW